MYKIRILLSRLCCEVRMKKIFRGLLLTLLMLLGSVLVYAASDNELNSGTDSYSTKDLILYGSLGVRLLSPDSF